MQSLIHISGNVDEIQSFANFVKNTGFESTNVLYVHGNTCLIESKNFDSFETLFLRASMKGEAFTQIAFLLEDNGFFYTNAPDVYGSYTVVIGSNYPCPEDVCEGAFNERFLTDRRIQYYLEKALKKTVKYRSHEDTVEVMPLDALIAEAEHEFDIHAYRHIVV